MTDNEIRQEIELSEEASEEKAAYNLDKIRKLERRVNVLQNNITALDMRGAADGVRIQGLENALADARRDHALLVRLVERMGRAVNTLTEWYCNDGPPKGPHIESSYPLTPIGQREYDAAMHDEEDDPAGDGGGLQYAYEDMRQ